MPAVRADAFPESAREAVLPRLEALRSDPVDAQANGECGKFLHAHDQFDSAAALYRRAEVLSDGEFEWTYLLGVVEQESGSYESAVEAFRLSLTKRDYVPAAIRLGEALASLERPREAQQAFEDALQIDRNQPAAYYALGRTLLELGELDEARALLTRAIGLSPNSRAAHYSLGLAYRDAGDDASAQRHLALAEKYPQEKPPIDDPVLSAVENISADEHYYLNLGRRLEERGRLTDAVAAYQRALEMNPQMAAAHANLVGTYGQLGQVENAEAHYSRAIEINSQLEELHNNWGVLQAMQERPAAAADAFRKSLGINPRSAEAHANLGIALMQLGDTKSAVEHLESALSTNPSHRSALLNLGRYELEAGRVPEAIAHLDRALQGPEDSRTAFILYSLAHAYGQSGMDRKAIEMAQSALVAAESFGVNELATQIRREFQGSP